MTEKHAPHIPTLDGWRAVAIALVLMGHASDEIARAASALGIQIHLPHELGLLGVQIFFALSGYLITTNLLEEEASGGNVSLGSFYLRRVFRILPAACVFLLAVALLTAVDVLDVTPWRWFATLFLLSNYTAAPGNWYLGHFWSLAIEEHFYLFWPLAFATLARNGRRLAFCLGAVLAIAVWRAVAFKYHLTWTSAAVFWGRTDLQVDGILCGVALAVARRLPRARTVLDGLLSRPAALPILLLLVVFLDMGAQLGWKSMMASISLRNALLPLLILSTVLRPGGVVGRVLETSAFRWLGKVSYSLYLWQQLFLVADPSLAPRLGPLQSFPVGLVASLACAWASFSLVERPLIAWGRRWRHAMALRSANAAAR